jgi:hypothetical protein
MKKIFSFLLLGLFLSIGNVWAETKTEGFETAAASTTYNSTVSITAGKSDCGIAWTIYYGTVSTNDKISGSKSAQMRWYASATENYPYIKSTTAVDGLSNITLKARTSNTNVKMEICYSEDGETWTVGKTHTFTAANTAENESLDIPAGNKFVKFGVSSSSTAPSTGNYKLIVDDVVFTYTEEAAGETPTWNLNPSSATVDAGETTTIQLTTNYDGTLSFVSEDENIATVSYNSSTKVITINGVSAGITSISATGAATANYKAINQLISVTVNHPELESNFTNIMTNWGYEYFGYSPSGSDTYAQPNVAVTNKTNEFGIKITFDQAESTTLTRYDANCVRFYKSANLIVTAPAGTYITKIVLLEPETGKSWSGTITPNVGEYVSDAKTWYATTPGVTSLTLANPDAAKRIGGMEVYLNVLDVTLGANGWSTYSAAFSYAIIGAQAYKAKYQNGAIVLTEVSVVAAGEGIILTGTEGATVNIAPASESADDFTDNELVGVLEPVVAEANYYVLATLDNDGITKFHPCPGVEIPANKAFIIIDDVNNAPVRIVFAENGATNIEQLDGSEKAVKFFENGNLFFLRNGVVYDATGRVVR